MARHIEKQPLLKNERIGFDRICILVDRGHWARIGLWISSSTLFSKIIESGFEANHAESVFLFNYPCDIHREHDLPFLYTRLKDGDDLSIRLFNNALDLAD